MSSFWEGYSRAHDFAFSSASSSFARTNICTRSAPLGFGISFKPHRLTKSWLDSEKSVNPPCVWSPINQNVTWFHPKWFGTANWSKYVHIHAILHRRVIDFHLVDPLPSPLFFFFCFLGLPAVCRRKKETQIDYVTYRKGAPQRG